MPQRKINIRATFTAVWKLYGKCFFPLMRFILPLLALAQVVGLIGGKLNVAGVIGLSIVAWGISNYAHIKSLKLFLNHAGCRTEMSVSLPVFFFFLFVTSYIGIVSYLALFALIIPALLVYASAILVPALIADQGWGPFEAIAESVEQTKGNVWRICSLLFSVWIPIFIFGAIVGAIKSSAGAISQPISFLLSTGEAFFGLLFYALTAVIYVELQPNISLQRDAPQVARPELERYES